MMDKKSENRKHLVRKLKDWQLGQGKAYQTYIKTSAVGLEFGLAIVIGALLGYFFDRHFKTSPYGLMVGVLVGTVAAVKRLWMFVKSYLEKNDHDDD